MNTALELLKDEITATPLVTHAGRIVGVQRGVVRVAGLSRHAALGDNAQIETGGAPVRAEVVAVSETEAMLLTDGVERGLKVGQRVTLVPDPGLAPSNDWVGRVIDAYGQPLDGRPLQNGTRRRPIHAVAPPAMERRGLGPRLATGLALFDTLLPLVQGQRIGLFSGSGVGKSTLLSQLARGVEADLNVIALVGERGREVREFIERTLGPEGMQRSIIVAATSDQSAIARRRCLWTAMTIAEHFRETGHQVLFLADSVTRFAEAHREVALAGGEPATLRGFPPSTAQMLMQLAERAGPGTGERGDITALFTVLVAGSDMEEPVADILRGVLDGHVVLNREIAERGRFPAVDLLRSVSRALPEAAGPAENEAINAARRIIATYEQAELMVQSGLYTNGSDPSIDQAIVLWPKLDAFLTEMNKGSPAAAFARLNQCLSGG